MCYQCNTVSKNPNDILIHTVKQHEAGGKFSLRQRIFDESIGHYAYRSIHFAIDIIKLKENHKKGYISNVNCEEKNISFKRKLKVKTDCCEIKQTQRYLHGLKPTFQNCIAYSPMSLIF